MNTVINTPKYKQIQRVHMTANELRCQLDTFKSKLWRYIEVTPSHSHNDNYINYLEHNIAELKLLLKTVNKVA